MSTMGREADKYARKMGRRKDFEGSSLPPTRLRAGHLLRIAWMSLSGRKWLWALSL